MGRPEGERRSAKHEGYQAARWAVPRANAGVRSTKATRQPDGPSRGRTPECEARRLPGSPMGRPEGERRSAEHEGYVATWRIGPIIAESSRTHVHNDSLRGQHARMPPEESPMSVVAFTRLASIMAFAVVASVATLASANAAAQ